MELETQIVISADLEYLAAARSEPLEARAIEVTRMLNGMLKHFNGK
jgi:hypothetical protein